MVALAGNRLFRKGNNMAERSGFISTPAGAVPAIGGSESDYTSGWPLANRPIFEATFNEPPKGDGALTIHSECALDMSNWRLFAVDFGRDLPEQFYKPKLAFFYDLSQDLARLPKPSQFGRPYSYKFLVVFERDSKLIAVRDSFANSRVDENFRGFPELWNSLKRYPWATEDPLHKPVSLAGFVSTPCGTVPAVCGSSDDYQGTPWPFDHREIPAYRALYPYGRREDLPDPIPAAELLEPMDLSLWTPVAINLGSVSQLPVAVFQRGDQFRKVTIEHGERFKGPFWKPSDVDSVAEYLSKYFSHTKCWPAIVANEWMQPYVPDLIRSGYLWPAGWNPEHNEREPQEWDGPAMPYSWKSNGNVVPDRMTPTAWRLVNYLWAQPKHVSAYDDSLAREVFDDHEANVDKTRVGSHRRAANKFFSDNGIAWRVTAKRDAVELFLNRDGEP